MGTEPLRELGIDGAMAQSSVAALLPAVLGGMQDQAESHPEDLDSLASILGGMGGGGLLSQVVSAGPTDPGAGNNVLGQIFGSKATSRAVTSKPACSRTS